MKPRPHTKGLERERFTLNPCREIPLGEAQLGVIMSYEGRS